MQTFWELQQRLTSQRLFSCCGLVYSALSLAHCALRSNSAVLSYETNFDIFTAVGAENIKIGYLIGLLCKLIK